MGKCEGSCSRGVGVFEGVFHGGMGGNQRHRGGGGAYAVGAGGFDVSALVSAIREGMSGMNGSGDIVIPVYLGGTMLDEVIVNAQQRSNLRSGGR